MCMKTCIHYLNRKLLRRLASYKVYLCLWLCVRVNTVMILLFILIFVDFVYIIGFLFMIVYEVLYVWCLRYI